VQELVLTFNENQNVNAKANTDSQETERFALFSLRARMANVKANVDTMDAPAFVGISGGGAAPVYMIA
jgi:hypothetical protein